MDSDMEISLDKLPIKRLESIEENGAERFPSDVDYDDKRVSLIRRVDFVWALEEEDDLKKKKKKQKKDSSEQWKWKGMVENLQLAHQELSVIIDLIDTVSITLKTALESEDYESAAKLVQRFLQIDSQYKDSLVLIRENSFWRRRSSLKVL